MRCRSDILETRAARARKGRRSLALWWLLDRQGVPSDRRIGLAREEAEPDKPRRIMTERGSGYWVAKK